jgi:PBP superfamily domain
VKRSLVLSAVLLAFAWTPAFAQDNLRLTGSGATFPFPLYSTWFKAFSAKQKNVSVDYQGKGSGAGIQDFTNRTVDFAWDRAAGAYVRMLSRPQLFIEGNHRTGALLMSYILVRDGLPPFVLSTDSAAAYFDPSTVVKDVDKNSPAMLFRLSRVTEQLAGLLRERCDSRHLIV